MMNYKLIILLSGALFASCIVDYDPVIKSDSECIVVNACLQPDSLITVRFYANRVNDGKSEIVRLQGAYVVLKENDKILYDNVSDSVLQLDVYPKVNAKYSITVCHAGYPDVEAETGIPQSVACEVGIAGHVYKVYDFHFPEKTTPLWIICTAFFRDAEPFQYSDLFTNNPLIDNVNRSEGLDFMDVSVGSGYHEGFLRIKPDNQPKLTEILFLPMLKRSILWEGYLGDEIRLIAASREYDQYCKTLYQMLANPSSGSEFNAILYQPVHVYTNIKGGRGIFAGKSEVCYFIKYVGKDNNDDNESD
jgi:hypothetical protein